ncbi:MAG: DUF58 domain-containing protein [Spirochaetaceae bacterium]|nr:DUF58 domain-containing protein [Spirochaetaceae bacterium]
MISNDMPSKDMISPELIRKIRYIQLRTRRTVTTAFAGEYRSVFRGQGMEFDEVREYQPGDDVGSIDWNVTARTGRPHVKRFVEERELTVFFVVDVSASGRFGSAGAAKTEVAAELAAVVSFAAARQNDRVGLLAFSDRIELFVPAKKGITHVLRIVREILSIQPAGTGTDLAGAMRYLNLVLRRRATVFLISDFLCGGGTDDAPPWWSRLAGGPAGSREAETSAPIPSTTDLRMAARRHDLIAASIFDPREAEMPPAGMVELEDAESGRLTLLDTGSRRVRRDYERRSRGRREALSRQLRELGIDEIPIRTDASWVDRLGRFFRMRERRAAWA